MSARDSILKNLFTDEENKQILFDQYRLYVEMANEVSNRREKANKFYILIISLFITIFSTITSITHEIIIFIVPIIIIPSIGYTWMKNIESYSTLNHGKFDVITEIENKLPAKGFTIEWELIELYNHNELTKIEKKIPIIVSIIAVIAIILILFIQKGCCIF